MKQFGLALALCASFAARAEWAAPWAELESLHGVVVAAGIKHHSVLRWALSNGRLDSPEMKDAIDRLLTARIARLDALTSLLGRHGWPSARSNREASAVALATLQEADPITQRQYFPLMHEAQQHGDIQPATLAEFEDQLLMREGLQQRYGSQTLTDADGTKRFAPIEDEEQVDTRRLAAGLEPLMSYAMRLGLQYPPNVAKLPKCRCMADAAVNAPDLPDGSYRLVIRFRLRADGGIERLRVHSAAPKMLKQAVVAAYASYRCLPGATDLEIALDRVVNIRSGAATPHARSQP